MSKPLVIQYMNLLHKHQNSDAKAVKKFMQKHVDDEVFVSRAAVLRSIFVMSKALKESNGSQND
jgi:hypothetical protein